jgi:hypothetical protein
MVPTKIKRWNSFSATNVSQNEAKLGYVELNIPTACPPRAAVSVNQGRGLLSFFQLNTPDLLLVMAATTQAMLTAFKT